MNPHVRRGALRRTKGRVEVWRDGSAAGPGAPTPRAILLVALLPNSCCPLDAVDARHALDAVDAIVPLRLPTQS